MAAFEIVALNEGTPQLRAPGSADTYIANRSFEIKPGTITTAIPVLDLAVTWNNAGVTFAGLRFNVIDTASNSGSLLLQIQKGGVNQFTVTKDGRVTVGENLFCALSLLLQSNTSSIQFGGSGDLQIHRDAANIFAQRNGASAQTKRLYGTWTDASNGRWLEMAVTTAGVASLRPTGNGTGASGNVLHISGLPTSNPGPGILWNNAGTPAIGT